jgi:hypothetical protein
MRDEEIKTDLVDLTGISLADVATVDGDAAADGASPGGTVLGRALRRVLRHAHESDDPVATFNNHI